VEAPRAPMVGSRFLFAALAVVLAAVSVLVQYMTPSAQLARPMRPFEDRGVTSVRMASPVYPRVAIGADDERVTLAAPPRRIVSQDWAADDLLYTVVPPERVVGVSEPTYQKRLSNTYTLAERYRPAVTLYPEEVLRANPDLVLTASARAEVPGLLRAAGLPVYRINTLFETLDAIEAHIRLVGYLTGEDARADAEARRFHDAIRRAAARKPAGLPPPRVLGFGGQYSYGAETLFTDILRVLGAENIAATKGFVGYDRLTDEHIARWNPDWIVAGADRGKVDEVRARLLAHPAIGATNAARHGRIIVLEHHIFLPLSPYTAPFVEALAEAFYGGHAS